MILRRVIQHVKKQEWTAIAIDFCIVVLGVFVGIQTNGVSTMLCMKPYEHTIFGVIVSSYCKDDFLCYQY